MKNKISDSKQDVYLETVRERRRLEGKRVASLSHRKKHHLDPNSPRGRLNAFMHQEVDPGGFGLIPEGYEGITYLSLILFIPKLVGMGFFFFYVSNAHLSFYTKAHTGGSLLDWMIGYEILMVLTLFIIGVKLLGYMFKK